MSTKKQTTDLDFEGVMGAVQNALQIVKLCAFASEARRTLTDIDLACDLNSETDATLSRLVEARRQWKSQDDNLGTVLNLVAHQLDEVHQRLEDAT